MIKNTGKAHPTMSRQNAGNMPRNQSECSSSHDNSTRRLAPTRPSSTDPQVSPPSTPTPSERRPEMPMNSKSLRQMENQLSTLRQARRALDAEEGTELSLLSPSPPPYTSTTRSNATQQTPNPTPNPPPNRTSSPTPNPTPSPTSNGVQSVALTVTVPAQPAQRRKNRITRRETCACIVIIVFILAGVITAAVIIMRHQNKLAEELEETDR
jgi:hypothetical protein